MRYLHSIQPIRNMSVYNQSASYKQTLCSFKLNRKRKNVSCSKRLHTGINLLLENNLVFKSIMDGVNASHEFSTHIWKSIKWNKEGKVYYTELLSVY